MMKEELLDSIFKHRNEIWDNVVKLAIDRYGKLDEIWKGMKRLQGLTTNLTDIKYTIHDSEDSDFREEVA